MPKRNPKKLSKSYYVLYTLRDDKSKKLHVWNGKKSDFKIGSKIWNKRFILFEGGWDYLIWNVFGLPNLIGNAYYKGHEMSLEE